MPPLADRVCLAQSLTTLTRARRVLEPFRAVSTPRGMARGFLPLSWSQREQLRSFTRYLEWEGDQLVQALRTGGSGKDFSMIPRPPSDRAHVVRALTHLARAQRALERLSASAPQLGPLSLSWFQREWLRSFTGFLLHDGDALVRALRRGGPTRTHTPQRGETRHALRGDLHA